ncbi:MAG: type II toxin-antitoxin system RelE/ParE family toxin [Calditrichia bacterium]
MRLSFKTRKLERSLTNDKETLKSYGTRAKKIKQRISQLKAAPQLSVIATLPALRLHQYIGKRKGTWSIDIHENWRICFQIDHDPVPTLEDGGVDLDEVTAIRISTIEDPH